MEQIRKFRKIGCLPVAGSYFHLINTDQTDIHHIARCHTLHREKEKKEFKRTYVYVCMEHCGRKEEEAEKTVALHPIYSVILKSRAYLYYFFWWRKESVSSDGFWDNSKGQGYSGEAFERQFGSRTIVWERAFQVQDVALGQAIRMHLSNTVHIVIVDIFLEDKQRPWLNKN